MPSGTASTSSSEDIIATAAPQVRWWPIPVTIAIVVVVSLVQVAAELLWLGEFPLDGSSVIFRPILFAHLLAGTGAALLFTAIRVARGSQTGSLRYSERYLVGLGYGIVTSLTTSVITAALVAESAAQAVAYAGAFLSASLMSLELPVACVVGGLSWHLLTKAPAGTPPPRRPIEDA